MKSYYDTSVIMAILDNENSIFQVLKYIITREIEVILIWFLSPVTWLYIAMKPGLVLNQSSISQISEYGLQKRPVESSKIN